MVSHCNQRKKNVSGSLNVLSAWISVNTVMKMSDLTVVYKTIQYIWTGSRLIQRQIQKEGRGKHQPGWLQPLEGFENTLSEIGRDSQGKEFLEENSGLLLSVMKSLFWFRAQFIYDKNQRLILGKNIEETNNPSFWSFKVHPHKRQEHWNECHPLLL